MPRPKILVLVLAGGAGGRLELLTEGRAKPAVPFAGLYRLIDFPLSNCHHAEVTDVWVAQQFNPAILTRHLSNGRPWDLDRNVGGLLLLHPHRETGQESGEEGWHRGTADVLWRNRALLRNFFALPMPGQMRPKRARDDNGAALVVVSADAVYRLDYREVVDGHLQSGADATMVTTTVAPEDAGRYGVVQVRDGRVTDYRYKPEQPQGNLISNEVFVFSPAVALDLLDDLAADVDAEAGLQDLGSALLPALVADHAVREHRFDGYWRDVGTVDSYWDAHLELTDPDPPFELDDLAWPILTYGHQRPAVRISAGTARESLLSPGVLVQGEVERSVLSPGVVVEPGASVHRSILLPDARVGHGAVVEDTIVDDEATIGAGARVGRAGGGITMIGRGARVDDGADVSAGGRISPGA